MPADSQKARELFLHAVGRLTPEHWDGYVSEACAGDADLEQQVQRYLQVHREAGSFLESPAVGLLAPLRGEELAVRGALATVDEAIAERPGMMIGPYKLMEEIGAGGFGLVFVAEQQQPVRRKVALKV